jgi:hypothetical protein
MAARQAVDDRLLATIAHNGTITHTGIPNPADSDIPRYAAIRFPNCLSGNEAQLLQDQVEELKNVRSTAGFFPAYILTTTRQDAFQNSCGPRRHLSLGLDWIVAQVLQHAVRVRPTHAEEACP